MADTKWIEFNPPERKRTYVFVGGMIAFEGVSRVRVLADGFLQLETTGGRKAIISPGWLWLEIDADAWPH